MVERKIEEANARHQAEIALLNRMASIIDSLPEHIAANCYIFSDYLDFNTLTREPDSCRVIEVEEEVPATKIVRRKLVCSGPEV